MYLNFVGAEDTGIIKAAKCQVLHTPGTRTGNVDSLKFVSHILSAECLRSKFSEAWVSQSFCHCHQISGTARGRTSSWFQKFESSRLTGAGGAGLLTQRSWKTGGAAHLTVGRRPEERYQKEAQRAASPAPCLGPRFLQPGPTFHLPPLPSI